MKHNIVCEKCSSYSFGQGKTEDFYCQDSADKCWSKTDCTGDGHLCVRVGATCACNHGGCSSTGTDPTFCSSCDLGYRLTASGTSGDPYYCKEQGSLTCAGEEGSPCALPLTYTFKSPKADNSFVGTCSSGACKESPPALAAPATTTGATVATSQLTALHKWNFMGLSSFAPGSRVIDYIGGALATHVSGASASSPAGDSADRTKRGVRLGTTSAPQSHIELDFVETKLGGALTIEMVVMFDKFNEHSRIFSCYNTLNYEEDAMTVSSHDAPTSTSNPGVVGSRLGECFTTTTVTLHANPSHDLTCSPYSL